MSGPIYLASGERALRCVLVATRVRLCTMMEELDDAGYRTISCFTVYGERAQGRVRSRRRWDGAALRWISMEQDGNGNGDEFRAGGDRRFGRVRGRLGCDHAPEAMSGSDHGHVASSEGRREAFDFAIHDNG